MIFKKNTMSEEEIREADRKISIKYLIGTTDEDYKKVLKIVEIQREANLAIQAVELGSKKAAREAQKANGDIAEAATELVGEYEEAAE